MSDSIEVPVLETKPESVGAADPKLAAMGLPDSVDLAGFEHFGFRGSMRKAFLSMTGNELENTYQHCQAYLKERQLPEDDLKDPEKSWQIMNKAVPDFLFHLTSLAFLCASKTSVLSGFIGKPKETYREAVLAWWDGLTEQQWSALTIRAFQELMESNVGNDYIVKDEPGSKPSPNL